MPLGVILLLPSLPSAVPLPPMHPIQDLANATQGMPRELFLSLLSVLPDPTPGA